MTVLGWIILTGFGMSLIALVGAITLVVKKATLDRIIMPLVAFAAGSLLGGAFLHIPRVVSLVVGFEGRDSRHRRTA